MEIHCKDLYESTIKFAEEHDCLDCFLDHMKIVEFFAQKKNGETAHIYPDWKKRRSFLYRILRKDGSTKFKGGIAFCGTKDGMEIPKTGRVWRIDN